MAQLLRLRWEATQADGLPRRSRRPCWYEAYAPDPLTPRSITLDGDVAADVADAERELAHLDLRAEKLVSTETLARLLLRAESVASSRIEGLEVGGRRLLRAEAARALGDDPRDVTAQEVLANVDAMAWAVESINEGDNVSVSHLLEIHRRLLSSTRLSTYAGQVRQQQNWIGRSDHSPCEADFVPPPHELVPSLLDDLCRFCNDESLPAVAQAAIAHAQFETIHPFVDGNGRVGRALIQLVLRRRGLTSRVIPPVSLVLATWSREYVDGLVATRYRGNPASKEAHEGLNTWIALFSAACRRAVGDAFAFEDGVRVLEERWRRKLGRVRRNSAADLLLSSLAGAPIVTVDSASKLIERSFPATNNAIARLVDADILAPTTIGRRNRAFEARAVISLFTRLERQLASAASDTRVAPPSRRVPRQGARS